MYTYVRKPYRFFCSHQLHLPRTRRHKKTFTLSYRKYHKEIRASGRETVKGKVLEAQAWSS